MTTFKINTRVDEAIIHVTFRTIIMLANQNLVKHYS
jgi:hypothetical protein